MPKKIKNSEQIHITSDYQKATAISKISQLPENGRFVVEIHQSTKHRTTLQNRALHLYLYIIAEMLNDAGLDQQMVIEKFKEGFSLPVSADFLKEVFKKIAEGITGKTSTTKLTTKEIQEVYEVFNRGFAEKYGVSAPWPSREDKDET